MKSLFGGNNGIDLDLGCLYELKDGRKGAVQALGNLLVAPFISLDGDDRSGNFAKGENLKINGNQIIQFKRILVYTFIYERHEAMNRVFDWGMRWTPGRK